MSQKSYYQILNLGPAATQLEIRNAFRKLAKLYHPDKNRIPGSSKKFREIVTAYKALKNTKQKKSSNKSIFNENLENRDKSYYYERDTQNIKNHKVKLFDGLNFLNIGFIVGIYLLLILITIATR